MSVLAVPAPESSALQRRLLEETPWYEVQQEGPGDPRSADFKGGVVRMHPIDGGIATLTITAGGIETFVGSSSWKARITAWATEGKEVRIEATDEQGRWARVTVIQVRFRGEGSQRGTPETRRDVDAILWTVRREPTPEESAASGGAVRDGVVGYLYLVSARDRAAVPEAHEF